MSSLDFLFIKFNGKIFFSSLSPNLNQREERERKINGKKSKKKNNSCNHSSDTKLLYKVEKKL